MSTNIWFTADTHFGHGRIIRYCNRPFKDNQEMDETILQRFNEVIRKGDRLYHLGDVCWSTYDIHNFLGRLNTKMVYLIRGNHDNKHQREYGGFVWVRDYEKVTVEKVGTVLFHYPIRSWNGKGAGGFQLYGHCHGTIEPGMGRSMDVGVDTHNFYPYNWDEIYEKLKDKPIFEDDPRDSHNRNG